MFAPSNGINPHNALCSFPFETTATHFCVLLVVLQFPCSSLCYFAHHPENLHFKYHLFKLSLLLSLSLCAKLKTIQVLFLIFYRTIVYEVGFLSGKKNIK